MASNVAIVRLRKEYMSLQKTPIANIRACPLEENILEWHYVLEGAKGTVYENGWYHGTVSFPSEYPMKPPSIQMITPNGRFQPKTRLCLSISDFHPETWNPLWSVGTILVGLYSFMGEDSPTYGSIVTDIATKRKAANESLQFNCKNKIFCRLFPELVELNTQRIDTSIEQSSSSITDEKEFKFSSCSVLIGIMIMFVAVIIALLKYLI